ncbi:MAG: hypothetical protein QOG45_2176, partial [Chloroflexota bacterium]|nr:hypothetical protein [Chloroflexota bacterium]
ALRVLHAHNGGGLRIVEGLVIPASDPLVRRPQQRDGAASEPREGLAAAMGVRVALSVPVMGTHDRVLGSLCAASQRRLDPNPNVLVAMRLFARLMGARMSQLPAPATAEEVAHVTGTPAAQSDTVTRSTPAAA